MSYKLKDIIYETKNYWVLRTKKGFEIYKIGITYSTKCAQFGYKGKNKAIEEAKRRELSLEKESI